MEEVRIVTKNIKKWIIVLQRVHFIKREIFSLNRKAKVQKEIKIKPIKTQMIKIKSRMISLMMSFFDS